MVSLCPYLSIANPLPFFNRSCNSVDTLASSFPEKNHPSKQKKRLSRLAGRVVNLTVERDAFIRVVLKNKVTGALIETIADADGQFNFDLESNSEYSLTAIKTSAASSEKSLRKSAFHFFSFGPKMLKVGDIITLDNILYSSDKFSILPRSTKELDRLVNTMKKTPSLHFEIGVHTDSRGNAELNNYLSQKRAQSIMDYFLAQGILKSRLKPKGYGETELLNECRDEVLCTEAEHRRNQRVEFKVLLVK